MGDGNENQKHHNPEFENGYEGAFGLDCPYCDNKGHYGIGNGDSEKCQFCHIEPNSKFNRRKQTEMDV